MQQPYEPGSNPDVPPFASTAPQGPIFHEPFIDIPPMMCTTAGDDIPEQLSPLDFSLEEPEDLDLQEQDSLELAGKQSTIFLVHSTHSRRCLPAEYMRIL